MKAICVAGVLCLSGWATALDPAAPVGTFNDEAVAFHLPAPKKQTLNVVNPDVFTLPGSDRNDQPEKASPLSAVHEGRDEITEAISPVKEDVQEATPRTLDLPVMGTFDLPIGQVVDHKTRITFDIDPRGKAPATEGWLIVREPVLHREWYPRTPDMIIPPILPTPPIPAAPTRRLRASGGFWLVVYKPFPHLEWSQRSADSVIGFLPTESGSINLPDPITSIVSEPKHANIDLETSPTSPVFPNSAVPASLEPVASEEGPEEGSKEGPGEAPEKAPANITVKKTDKFMGTSRKSMWDGFLVQYPWQLGYGTRPAKTL